MCNSHCTSAVAFDVLQMLLERPVTKSSRHLFYQACTQQMVRSSCIPSFKKAGQNVASVIEDQLNVNVLCGFSNGFKVAAGLTEIHSNLCSHPLMILYANHLVHMWFWAHTCLPNLQVFVDTLHLSVCLVQQAVRLCNQHNIDSLISQSHRQRLADSCQS